MALFLETFLGNALGPTFGMPEITAIAVLAFFTIIVMVQGTRLDGKLCIVVPAVFLAAAFISWIVIPIGVFLGFIMWFAFKRLFG